MIVAMAKVEIVGPRPQLLAVLAALSELEAVQVEGEAAAQRDPGGRLHHLLPDPEMLAQRLRFETLRDRLNELHRLLPPLETRSAYLDPAAALPSLEQVVPHHLAACRERQAAHERLLEQAQHLEERAGLLTVMDELAAGLAPAGSLLDLVGVTLRDASLVEALQRDLESLAAGRAAVATGTAADGTLVGVIAVERESGARLREALSREGVGELDLLPELRGQPLAQQVDVLQKRAAEIRRQAAVIFGTQESFARRWLPIYRRVGAWLDAELTLLRAAAEVVESRFCFFLSGWMPTERVAATRAMLTARFGGEVLLGEQELRHDDLERVPVALRNPPYFRPFELLLRLLPLPRYTSCDPTPFLGLFFPLFFGLMLGDIGYGAILLAAALVLLVRGRRTPGMQRDLGGILLPCAVASIAFGLAFGEFFGEHGAHALGLHPLLVSRSEELTPMLWFALSVGTAHVLIGLGLGIATALRTGNRHQLWARTGNLLLLLALVLTIVAWGAPSPWVPLTPALLALGATVVLLLVTGGLLAPLETLKSIGNVISYARLMAIGLTSALLAHVANTLGGLTGNVVAGIFVAGTLHIFNLILGVFAPTVHALRLHYVEFFSKFLESGGRRYRPLEKRPQQGGMAWKRH